MVTSLHANNEVGKFSMGICTSALLRQLIMSKHQPLVPTKNYVYRWKGGVLSFKGVADLTNIEWFWQLPFLIATSVGAALLGAIFNALHKWVRAVRVLLPSNTSVADACS